MINNHVNPDEVLKKFKKKPLIAYISIVISIAFFGLAIFGLIELINNDESAIIFLITGLAMSIPLFFVSLFHINKSKKNIASIDFNELKKELSGEVLGYHDYKTYFTKNYLISNYYYAFAVKYTDILWIYKDVGSSFITEGRYDNLVICLRNGKKAYLFNLKEFMDEIEKRNPKVLVGNAIENKKKYKELIRDENN